MSDTEDLFDTDETIPPVTTQPVQHAAANGDVPVPPWQAAVDRAIEDRRRRGLPVTTRVPLGMLPGDGGAGLSTSQLERAQEHAGMLGAQALNKIVRATLIGEGVPVPAPAPQGADAETHKGVTLDVRALWRLIKRLLFKGKNGATG